MSAERGWRDMARVGLEVAARAVRGLAPRGSLLGRRMGLATVVMFAGVAWGQPTSGPAASGGAGRAEEPFALPSLNALLGLEEGDGERGREGEGLAEVIDPEQEALDRRLSSGEMAEALGEAVDLMGTTAERLTAAQDVGIVTQRLQEDILARLDAVISAAEEQNSSSSSSSSSSQQQQQQQQASQPGQQGEEQQGEQGDESDTSGQENNGEAVPPGGRDGALAPPVSPDGGAWGRLPPRVRDSLVQGSTDVFSSLYRRMTELYYRRLAEEERR